MSKTRYCECGEEAHYYYPNECEGCHLERLRNEEDEFNSRMDVSMLNDCNTVEELKDWIKEHLIK